MALLFQLQRILSQDHDAASTKSVGGGYHATRAGARDIPALTLAEPLQYLRHAYEAVRLHAFGNQVPYSIDLQGVPPFNPTVAGCSRSKRLLADGLYELDIPPIEPPVRVP